ncbi:MAG: hypothetical protein OEV42_16420, partial [Deltaproteobacteria bacterium]|nr:hypothetical protein [Deltaproteobacteria bacterium]
MSSLLLSLRKSGLIAAIFSFFLTFHCSPILAASNAGLEADLQESLRTIQKLTDKALAKIQSGSDAAVEIREIKGYSDILIASDLLLKERFAKGAEKANALGVKAGARHNAVLDKYRRSMGEVIRLVKSLSDAGSMSASGNDQQGTLTQLKALLKQLLPKKRRPIHGALPYRHLNLPALLPVSNINVT